MTTYSLLTEISCRDLKLGDGPWKQRFDVNRNYLLSLERDAYLEAFYKCFPAPGVPEPKPTVSWTGWVGQKHNWTGHDGEFHGHYLSACARIIGLSDDSEMRTHTEILVNALARYQQPNGSIYIGYVNEKNIENLFRGIEPRTIVFYTIHKMLMGLYELYVYAQNQQAWEICLRWADDIARRVNALSSEEVEKILTVEHGGIAEIILDIAALSRRQEHFDTGIKLLQKSVLDPLVRNEDLLTDVHTNTTIPILHGAARAFELTGNRYYRDAVENFWNIVNRTRNYVTGSSSHKEFWRKPNALKDTLCAGTQETCVSYNWLRLTDYLLRWTGEAKYGDAYERCHINGIMAAQHPQTGQFIYFMPMKPGPRDPNPDGYDPDPPEQGGKHFGRPLRCFWCCYGTGAQAFGNPLTGAYYKNADSLWINQFIASEVQTQLNGKQLTLRQETNLPLDDHGRIAILDCPDNPFTLNIRIPNWVRNDAQLFVNHQPTKVSPGWLSLTRPWKKSDTIDLNLPMHLNTQPINDDPNCVAYLFGPHVLVGCVPDPSQVHVPRKIPTDWLVPQGNLVFHSKDPQPAKFQPLCNVTDEEYNVYFDME